MKPSPDTNLPPKQEAALLALLTHNTIEAAYEAADVSKATMWRWMQTPEFKARYRAARRQLVETALGALQKHATTAARVLVSIAVDKNAPAASRVSAAKAIIEQSVKAVELVDLQERIEALEASINEKGKGVKWA